MTPMNAPAKRTLLHCVHWKVLEAVFLIALVVSFSHLSVNDGTDEAGHLIRSRIEFNAWKVAVIFLCATGAMLCHHLWRRTPDLPPLLPQPAHPLLWTLCEWFKGASTVLAFFFFLDLISIPRDDDGTPVGPPHPILPAFLRLAAALASLYAFSYLSGRLGRTMSLPRATAANPQSEIPNPQS